MEAQTKNKLSVIAIALLFFTPVIITIVLNSKWVDFQPSSLKNKGNLIQPAVELPGFANPNPESYVWTLVYHAQTDCTELCLQRMEMMHRVRQTRGHKMDKVGVMVAHPNTVTVSIPEQFGEITHLSYEPDSEIEKTLIELSNSSLGENEGLFILAPEGFLMMSYAEGFKPDDVIDDLSLLLRGRKGE